MSFPTATTSAGLAHRIDEEPETIAKPPEAVALLADDEDFFVKLTLVERCVDAPDELIIEMLSYWHGLRWSFLTNRPNFVRIGMAADFAHASQRPTPLGGALHDPTGSPELVETLFHDPSSSVCLSLGQQRSPAPDRPSPRSTKRYPHGTIRSP